VQAGRLPGRAAKPLTISIRNEYVRGSEWKRKSLGHVDGLPRTAAFLAFTFYAIFSLNVILARRTRRSPGE
jgi:hypothetical protein